MKLAWALRAQKKWLLDVLRPIPGDGNYKFEWKGNWYEGVRKISPPTMQAR
jgi:hypothetical protein